MTVFAYNKICSNQYIKFNNMTVLKNIAFITMLLDHLAYAFMPENEILRFIGRFAFPIFSFIAVYNFLYNVNEHKIYLRNLLLLAIFSQLPYYLLFNTYILNIFFSFFFGLTSIYLLQRFNNLFQILFNIVFFSMLSFLVDFSIYGYVFILSLYVLFAKYNIFSIFLVLVSSFLINFPHLNYSFITLFFTILILLNLFFKFNLNIKFLNYRFDKYFYYFLYPFHLAIIYLLI